MAKRKQDEISSSCSKQQAVPPAAVGRSLREVLPEFNSLDQLVDLLRTCKRVVVVTGAGIRRDIGHTSFRRRLAVAQKVNGGLIETATEVDNAQ